jgi:hypothetical protein
MASGEDSYTISLDKFLGLNHSVSWTLRFTSSAGCDVNLNGEYPTSETETWTYEPQTATGENPHPDPRTLSKVVTDDSDGYDLNNLGCAIYTTGPIDATAYGTWSPNPYVGFFPRVLKEDKVISSGSSATETITYTDPEQPTCILGYNHSIDSQSGGLNTPDSNANVRARLSAAQAAGWVGGAYNSLDVSDYHSFDDGGYPGLAYYSAAGGTYYGLWQIFNPLGGCVYGGGETNDLSLSSRTTNFGLSMAKHPYFNSKYMTYELDVAYNLRRFNRLKDFHGCFSTKGTLPRTLTFEKVTRACWLELHTLSICTATSNVTTDTKNDHIYAENEIYDPVDQYGSTEYDHESWSNPNLTPRLETVTDLPPRIVSIVGLGNVTLYIGSPTLIVLAEHGRVANDPVVFEASDDLPTGITAGTTYYVSSISTVDMFEFSATIGGTPVNTSVEDFGVLHSSFCYRNKILFTASSKVKVTIQTATINYQDVSDDPSNVDWQEVLNTRVSAPSLTQTTIELTNTARVSDRFTQEIANDFKIRPTNYRQEVWLKVVRVFKEVPGSADVELPLSAVSLLCSRRYGNMGFPQLNDQAGGALYKGARGFKKTSRWFAKMRHVHDETLVSSGSCPTPSCTTYDKTGVDLATEVEFECLLDPLLTYESWTDTRKVFERDWRCTGAISSLGESEWEVPFVDRSGRPQIWGSLGFTTTTALTASKTTSTSSTGLLYALASPSAVPYRYLNADMQQEQDKIGDAFTTAEGCSTNSVCTNDCTGPRSNDYSQYRHAATTTPIADPFFGFNNVISVETVTVAVDKTTTGYFGKKDTDEMQTRLNEAAISTDVLYFSAPNVGTYVTLRNFWLK